MEKKEINKLKAASLYLGCVVLLIDIVWVKIKNSYTSDQIEASADAGLGLVIFSCNVLYC